MFFFRACPSCHGNLYLESDDYGTFVEYLQCGLLRDQVDREIGMADRLINLSSPQPCSRYPQTLSA